jgi:large subunit ribosomal protein L18
MNKKSTTYKRNLARQRRKKSIRKKIFGTPEMPRLAVFRSLVAFSSFAKGLDLDRKKKKTEQSFEVGQNLGKLALKKGIKKVRFDRGGYLYHGRVKALADGIRKAGLEF